MRTPILSALFILLGCPCFAADRPASMLPRSSPEAQGVSSTALLDFIETADRKIDALHSLMLVRHGHVVAEGWWSPYGADSPHELYSLSKSFTSTAVGLAVAEGKLSVNDKVLKFFPDDEPEKPGENLRSMRVSDLLRMSTGHQVEPKRPPDEVWTKHFLAQPVPFKPGTHFLYNTSGTYMLSAIVQKATGQTVLDYLRPRLFEPLGIEHPEWETSPQGVSLGGYGLSVRTEDIAKFGQLYLQKGKWNGKQLIPARWIEAATSRQTSNGSNPKSDWDQGYGYQFWRCRHGAYRGDGAFGQYCIVMPEQDAVVAITSGVRNMQAVLNVVWDKLLPALKSESLPPDESARKKLVETLKGLELPPQKGTHDPASRFDRKYTFPTNPRKIEAMRLEKAPGGAIALMVRIDGEDVRIECGSGAWKKGRFGFGPRLADQPAAASGGWVSDDTYKARICFYQTPFLIALTLKIDGDRLLLDADFERRLRPDPAAPARRRGRVRPRRHPAPRSAPHGIRLAPHRDRRPDRRLGGRRRPGGRRSPRRPAPFLAAARHPAPEAPGRRAGRRTDRLTAAEGRHYPLRRQRPRRLAVAVRRPGGLEGRRRYTPDRPGRGEDRDEASVRRPPPPCRVGVAEPAPRQGAGSWEQRRLPDGPVRDPGARLLPGRHLCRRHGGLDLRPVSAAGQRLASPRRMAGV